MKYTVNQLYQLVIQKPLEVYGIFKNFFGEDYVDFQAPSMQNCKESIQNFLLTSKGGHITFSPGNSCQEIPDEALHNLLEYFAPKQFTIYVWWPKVTVTNENNRSILIQDLYAKVQVQSDGCIPYEYPGFLLNRATYTREQFLSDYLHSHIQGIPKSDFTRFSQPCLGYGPIRDTITTLKNGYSETFWMLFCQELSLYVSVESLAGGPWRRLEGVGSRIALPGYDDYNFRTVTTEHFLRVFPKSSLSEFIKYYLQHGHLSLSYKHGRFTCIMPFYEYIIDVSNAFISFYNGQFSQAFSTPRNLYTQGLLHKAVVADGKFFSSNNTNQHRDLRCYNGRFVLRFKGNHVYTSIIDTKQSSAVQVTVLDNFLAMFILKNILLTVNYHYNNESVNHNSSQSSSSACQRVIFL